MLTAVSIGNVSSRLAAGVTWPIAAARAPPSAVPASCGSSGSSGYSPDGRVTSVNAASRTSRDAVGIVGELDREPRKAPDDLDEEAAGNQDRPGPATSAGTVTRADTS